MSDDKKVSGWDKSFLIAGKSVLLTVLGRRLQPDGGGTVSHLLHYQQARLMPKIAVTLDGKPIETMPIGLVAVLRLGESEEYDRDEARIGRELLDRGVELVILLAEGETLEMYDEQSMKAAGWVRAENGMAVAEDED